MEKVKDRNIGENVGKGTLSIFPVGTQTSAATLRASMEVFRKLKIKSLYDVAMLILDM